MSSKNSNDNDIKDNETYSAMEHKQHILQVPDTYIGSVEPTTLENVWICNSDNVFLNKDIEASPGFYNIFNEILNNAADQCTRTREYFKSDNTVQITTSIKVIVNEETGIISIFNDGDGIPVKEHEEKKIMIPELVFGQLLTSSNYDKNKKKTWGGKNGYGSKVTSIFSKMFEVETVDHRRGKKFKQIWEDNMSTPKNKAKVTSFKGKAYTKITFLPDYSRFGMPDGLKGDVIDLIRKRVYDIAGCTPSTVSVYFNNYKIPVRDFSQYVEKYIGKQKDVKRVYEKPNEFWEIIACASTDGNHQQVSIVNGICTINGGKHVDYVSNKICNELVKKVNGKNKTGDIKTSHVKNNLWVFINSLIVNPSFSSQTKEALTTPVANFGSKCELSEDFIKRLAKTEIIERAKLLKSVHDKSGLSKSDGKKTKNIRGIPKLDDANWAGTEKSNQCTLILTEGDSAKALVTSAIGVIGRDKYGVFPLRGKLLNIRDASDKQITGNAEIQNLKKILGLQQSTKSVKELRYGKILILCDQDVDGIHIKGLLMNMFASTWEHFLPEDFLVTMYTPLVKVRKGDKIIQVFYNQQDYEKWKNNQQSLNGLNIKYYKGLGTSSKSEAKEYFTDFNLVQYNWCDESQNALTLAFDKKLANKRKKWLSLYNKNDFVNPLDKNITYKVFVDKELIHFSNYDNHRSIPSFCDGNKPGQRKVLFTCFDKNLNKEKKVAQVASDVSGYSAYHHGEVSLEGTIVGMAQNFIGSNNINLLFPSGQFGCIDPNTPVLLWDSSIKKARDITIGDNLIGDDGTMRTVSKITSGIDDMYKISNGNMDNYIVNSHHILTISYSGHKSIFWKESTKSWTMTYFDDKNKCVKSKTFRTSLISDSKHFNKSKLNKEKAYEKIIDFSNTIPDNNIFDINVQEYLKLPKHVKHHIKGVLNKSVVEWKEQDVDIDPYILGLWLGDGMSSCSAFSSIDIEIIKEWAIWLDKIGCEAVHCENYNKRESAHYYIRRRGSKNHGGYAIGDSKNSSSICKGCLTGPRTLSTCDWVFNKKEINYECKGTNINGDKAINLNPFKELFKKNNLFKNKHIPIKYIINSKENRLKLLAGMIDTDGSLRKQKNQYSYHIFQNISRKHLLESLRIIAGSLGYRSKISKPSKDGILTLMISGYKLEEIPTKVSRKQIKTNKNKITRNPMVHSIRVTHVGKGEFCGWNIDKNERFLLGDFTITHNTRIKGGKDCAQSRYIFTRLEKITKLLYKKEDEPLLNFLVEEGQNIEPEWYLPVLPMVLVNGAHGIGTGFSTHVPSFNPKDIIFNLKKMMDNQKIKPLIPWYKNFKGNIIQKKVNGFKKWFTEGVWSFKSPTTMEITELPIGSWTDDYHQHLENLTINTSEKDEKKKKNQCIVNYKKCNDHDDENIHLILTFKKEKLNDLKEDSKKLKKILKLEESKSCSVSNLHLFDPLGEIVKFNSPEAILRSYYRVRLPFYKKRKEYQIKYLEREIKYLLARIRFIKGIIDDNIHVSKRPNEEILIELRDKHNFPPDPSKKEIIISPIKKEVYIKALDGEVKRYSYDDCESSDEESGSDYDTDEESDVKEEKEESFIEEDEYLNYQSPFSTEDEKSEASFPLEDKKDETREVKKILYEDYNYLLSMNLWTLTQEKLNELEVTCNKKKQELNYMNTITPKELWKLDLEELEKEL